MNDIGSMLRAADPIAREGGASAAASERMRRRIRSGRRAPRQGRGPLVPVLTAALVLVAIGGVWMTSRAEPTRADGARQLQLITPGGTRVLWTLHPKAEAR